MHNERHPAADKTATITATGVAATHPTIGPLNGREFVINDWWDRLFGKSWMNSDSNPAAIGYAIRSGVAGLPIDNEVVYGKVGGLGILLHVSEFEVPDA